MRYLSRPLARHLLTLAVVCCIPLHVHSYTTVTWTGTVGTDMTVALNWAGTPPSGALLVMDGTFSPTPHNYTPTLPAVESLSVLGIKFENYSSGHPFTMTINGDLTVTGDIVDSTTTQTETVDVTALTSNATISFTGTTSTSNSTDSITFNLKGASASIFAIMDISSDFGDKSIVNMQGYSQLNITQTGSNVTNVTFKRLSSQSTDTISLGGGATSTLTFGEHATSSTSDGAFSGTGGIIITDGTQTFGSTSNTYSGPTTINAGAIKAGGSNTLSTYSIVTINDSGKLQNHGSNTIPGLNSSSSAALVETVTSSSVLTISGSGTSTFQGMIIDSNPAGLTTSITVTEGQTLQLTGIANTYSGPTTVSNGSTLEAGASQALSLNSAITLDDTSSLKIDNNFSNTVPSLSSTSYKSTASIGSGATLTIGPGTTASSTFAGAFTGSGNLTIAADYTLSLAGAASSLSSLSGATEIDGEIDASSTTANTLPYASPITLGTNGVLNLEGQNNTIASLASTSTSSTVDLGGATLTMADTPYQISSFAGVIGPSGDAGSIYIDDGDQLTLTNDNLYQGSTTVNDGTLTLSSATGNTIAKSSGVILGSAGNLAQTTSNTINSLASTYTNSSVSILTGTVLTIGSGTANSSTFAGAFTGMGGLTIASNYTLSLAGAASNTNIFSGTTTIDGELDASPFTTNTLPSDSPIVLGANGVLSLSGQNNGIVSLASTFNTSKVNLGGATLTMGDTPYQITTFAGVIGPSGDSGSIYLDDGNQLTLTNDNLYQGTTTVNDGTLTLASPTGSTIAQSSAVIVNASGILDLTTDNTINNPSGAVGSQFMLNSNILTVNETNTTGTIAGVISGAGGELIMAGPNTLILLGANTYSGGTDITGGTLQGNTTSLQGDINVNSNKLIFNQTTNGIFNGTLSSSPGATLTKNGNGVLTFETSQAGYAGQTNVSAGTLNLNTILGGNVTVLSGATLTGNGTIGGNLTINGGGTISPGNSIGTITVDGNYVQQPNSTYVWELLSTGQADLVDVHGTASLAGALAITAPTVLPVNNEYLVLHADGGVTGIFTDVPEPVSPILAYELIYTPNDVYFSLHTTVSNVAETFNQQQVAAQIDSINNPTPEQTAFLNTFLSLSVEEVQEALNEMSGDQYTYLIPLARYANESFRNGIYNAMRNTLDPCWCPDPCERFETWFRAEVGRFNECGDRNCAGLHGTNWDMTVGAHGRLINGLQIGVAGNYQRNYVTYKQGGRTIRQTGQIAGYIVSRSEYGYFLGEGIYGNSSGSYRRPIVYGTVDEAAKSNPMTSQGLVYGEAGASFECNFWDCVRLLFQPFVGAEFGMYSQGKIKEHNADIYNLRIRRHHQTTFDSLLGLHFTSGIGCVDLSADVYWQHRFDPTKIVLQDEFVDFGGPFEIKGCKFDRNGVRGNLRAAYRVSRWIDVYADVSAESWGKWTSYAVDAGINAWW